VRRRQRQCLSGSIHAQRLSKTRSTADRRSYVGETRYDRRTSRAPAAPVAARLNGKYKDRSRSRVFIVPMDGFESYMAAGNSEEESPSCSSSG